eukprot:scaffold8872_cov118-Isochrysis_galbana.AAC.5
MDAPDDVIRTRPTAETRSFSRGWGPKEVSTTSARERVASRAQRNWSPSNIANCRRRLALHGHVHGMRLF